jgi:serine kinase of HPr protein (carbohydrate metabolism regulator)
MKISEIVKLIHAKVVCNSKQKLELYQAFASDLMSDVLRLESEHTLLITGLVNVQVIRTAEMADINCIVFARNKKVSEEMKQVAMENDILLLESPFSVFKTSGLLYQGGIKPIF